MNKFKPVFALLSGVVLGAVAGLLLAKKWFETEAYSSAEKEIEEMRKYFEEKAEDLQAQKDELAEWRDKIKNTKEKSSNPYSALAKDDRIITNEYERAKDDYPKMKDKTDIIKSEPEIDNSQPYLISATDFSDTNPNFEKMSLIWYGRDRVLSDENDEVVSDEHALLGDIGVAALHKLSRKKSTIWIRNELILCDYEIVYMDSAYPTSENEVMEREDVGLNESKIPSRKRKQPNDE